jgi:hypothetical protein
MKIKLVVGRAGVRPGREGRPTAAERRGLEALDLSAEESNGGGAAGT